LVESLARQIRGGVVYRTERGFAAEIRFGEGEASGGRASSDG